MARRTAAMPALGVARVDLREAGPEQQLVRVGRERRRALVQRPGLARAVGGHQLVGLARELVGARERDQPPQLARPGRGGPRPAGRSGPATARPRAAPRRAPPTGGRGRRRPPPPRRPAPPAAARRGRPRRPRSPRPSRPAPCRGPSCWPGRRRARRWRRPRTGCSRRRCGRRPGPPRRRCRPGARRRARPRRAARRARRAAPAPAARRSSPCGPWAGSTTDCVATAPIPGPGPDAERADGEPVRVHGGAVLPGGRVEGDDRIRPVAHERATIPG